MQSRVLVGFAVVSSLALWLAPAQLPAQSAEKAGTAIVAVEKEDACSGLNDQECCGQRLEYAGFQAQGEHLPRKISSTVKLACMQPKITEHVCRSIVTTRGFAAKQVDAVCKPAKARRACGKDKHCRQCEKDLRKLSYRNPHNVCRAVTYRPKRGRKVVVIRNGNASSPDAVEVTTRRTEVR